MLRLNRGAPLITNCVTAPPPPPPPRPPCPHCYQSPLYPWALHLKTPTRHVVPFTGVRVGPSAWPPATRQRHLRLARATWALPCGLSATLHLEVVPHVSACSSRLATSAPTSKNPLFAIFNRKCFKNSFKNQIKIRKRFKLQKFISLNVELLFDPNFVHWITNSFLFNIMSLKIYFERKNSDELEFT